MDDKLSPEQIADFKEAFSLFDHDENGSISAVELGEVLKALGQNPSKNELSDMINEVDVDGNGTVEFAEFVILMTNKVKELTKEEEIKEAFDVLDKEKDSVITAKELKYFMRKVAHIKLSSEEAEAMIDFAGKDGKVTFEDFLRVVELAQNPGTIGEGTADEGGNAGGGGQGGAGNNGMEGGVQEIEEVNEDEDD